MKIVSGGMNVLSLFVAELDARVILVRALVFRKTNVSVYPEQGTTYWSRVRSKLPADLS